ncbi:MAG: hypothetical protein H7039_20510, partial [Bryobacteraceae bacterium]|nr:hypothetical protein [Bryobacteraceae bacterium]
GFGAPRVPVASAVFRVPLVHGYGRNAVVLDFLEQAKRDGEARYVGTGENHWSAVHVDDLAHLYLLALEALASGALPPGTLIHPAATPTFSMRELAEAVAEGTGVGRTRSISIEEARGASPFPFADLYASDMRLDATFARETLGWRPSRLSLPEDIARGSYVQR